MQSYTRNINYKIVIYSCLIFVSYLFVACEQEDISTEVNQDWLPSDSVFQYKKPYLISSSEINVELPPAQASPAYLADLDAILIAQKSASEEDNRLIDEWAGVSLQKWNHIARELAAKYNYAPAANAAGIYPNPDPTNPLRDPKFPFANPPYAARMFAYLSVAQYDGLLAAWQKKYQFKHKRPYELNSSIAKKGIQHENLPAYPSHEALLAQTSAQLLKYFFPGEVEFIDGLLAENERAIYLSGESTSFAIKAGKSMGQKVAERLIEFAKTDGMAKANDQSVFTGQQAKATLLGISPLWKSQEIPARPPMLPNYGQVRTWHLSKDDIPALRPVLPPKYGEQQFQKEWEELKFIEKNQTREQARIANFWADGAGSYTPPGHWHRLTSETSQNEKLSAIRTTDYLALVSTALMDAAVACWETKYFYCTPRPQQFGVKTSVGVPNFPSYTSGHSTFSSTAAEILSHLFPKDAQLFRDKADEASVSRIYGLIHFRVDCEMGLIHGKHIAEKAIEKYIR